MGKLRFAVAGLGLGRLWAKLIHDAPEFELAGLIDTDLGRLKQASEQFGMSQSTLFSSYDRALVSLDADAIVVVTPPATHKEAVLAALDAGYHVLSEKPLAANMDEARQIAQRVSSSKLKFMVSQNYRWEDSVEAVRQAIKAGVVGQVGYITCDFHKGIRFGGWREELTEVLLEDMSIHHFDLLRHITGRDCLYLYARSFRPAWSWFSGNPSAHVILQMQGGLEVSYFGCWVSRGRETSWAGDYRIVGDLGAIHWDGQDPTLVAGHPEDNPREPHLTSESLPRQPLEHRGFEYSLYEFARAIDEDREPVTGVYDNIQSFAMTMAAIESASTGRTIDVQAYVRGEQ